MVGERRSEGRGVRSVLGWGGAGVWVVSGGWGGDVSGRGVWRVGRGVGGKEWDGRGGGGDGGSGGVWSGMGGGWGEGAVIFVCDLVFGGVRGEGGVGVVW